MKSEGGKEIRTKKETFCLFSNFSVAFCTKWYVLHTHSNAHAEIKPWLHVCSLLRGPWVWERKKNTLHYISRHREHTKTIASRERSGKIYGVNYSTFSPQLPLNPAILRLYTTGGAEQPFQRFAHRNQLCTRLKDNALKPRTRSHQF